MVRLKVMLAVTGVVVLLYIVLALAQIRDSPPWDQPVLCPMCESDRVVYILYGEPQMAEDLKRALASRMVELGGCIITPDSKRWECRSCGHRWGAVGHGAGAPP